MSETESALPKEFPYDVIEFFYPEDTPLRRLLLRHSRQVREKALAIAEDPRCPVRGLDLRELSAGALLHDIGILRCHAPGILCTGTEPYLAHGILGAQMLRDYGSAHGVNLERYARLCERHTGSGLTAEEIWKENLPIPARDYLPETETEKLICLADKFFSKSGDLREKTLPEIRKSMEKFGEAPRKRFDALCELFGLSEKRIG